jgi:multisubunit Na+/H+ antiporter MnhC subunit
MVTAIVVTIIVFALLVGTIMSLRRSAKTGMPSRETLERATQRARELEEEEKIEQGERGE